MLTRVIFGILKLHERSTVNKLLNLKFQYNTLLQKFYFGAWKSLAFRMKQKIISYTLIKGQYFQWNKFNQNYCAKCLDSFPGYN